MKITLKDGSVKEYAEAKSVIEIAADISEGLARAATAGEIDGEIVDLRTPVEKDCQLNIPLMMKRERAPSAIQLPISWLRPLRDFIRRQSWPSVLLWQTVFTMM